MEREAIGANGGHPSRAVAGGSWTRAQLTQAARRWSSRLLLLVLAGCAAADAAPTGVDQGFIPLDRYRDGFLRLTLPSTATMRICLTGSGVSDATRESYLAMVRSALANWLAVVQSVSKSPVIDPANIEIAPCDEQTAAASEIECGQPEAESVRATHDLVIHWYAPDDPERKCQSSSQCSRAHVCGDMRRMFLYNDSERTVSHEFGHVFGLADTYVEGGSTCQEGQPSSHLCFAGKIADDDRAGIYEMFCAMYPNDCKLRWSSSFSFCNGEGEQLHIGDFNGDRRSDLLCHAPRSGFQSVAYATPEGTFAEVGWVNESSAFCAGEGLTLLVGKVDGSAGDDLICHDRATGTLKVALASAPVGFAVQASNGSREVCRTDARGSLHTGSFNTDELVDLVCLDPTRATLTIVYGGANATFGRPWTRRGNFCEKPYLLAEDFTWDGRTDLLCHYGDARKDKILTASTRNRLDLPETTREVECRAPYRMHVGKFSADDGRADLSCANPSHFPLDWSFWFSSLDGSFVDKPSQERLAAFCMKSGEELFTGNFDADAVTDFLCHHPDGSISVAHLRPPGAAPAR